MNVKDEWSVAVVQMVSSDLVDENLRTVEEQIVKAVKMGAEIVVLPENFALMPKSSNALLLVAETLGEGVIQTFLSELSIKYQCWIVAGSLPIKSAIKERAYATCLVYNSVGEQVAY